MHNRVAIVGVITGTVLIGGAALAQERRDGASDQGTVDWYVQNPDGPDGRKAVLARCNNDPGRLAQTRECVNAGQADWRAFMSAPSPPTTGGRRF